MIHDERDHWESCTVCHHKIDPFTGFCEDIYHLPCGPDGCTPKEQNDKDGK